MGMNGAPGKDGETCDIQENDDGTITIRCGDGPAYRISAMREANGGGDMPADENDQFQGGTCENGDESLAGFCDNQATNTMPCEGRYIMGLCPGPAAVQCCVDHSCQTAGGEEGVCMNTDVCATRSVPGFCPGNNNVQCCVMN